ncbi:MAG: hypothetical protein V1759_01755 [bacterium]
MRLEKWAIVFIITAIILAVIGYIRNDYIFYIRAVIFTIAGGVAWWLDESGHLDKLNKKILKMFKR